MHATILFYPPNIYHDRLPTPCYLNTLHMAGMWVSQVADHPEISIGYPDDWSDF
jgi:hypothetical protein